MIKVSHEAPISILSYIGKLNDYQYCLPHLLDESLRYREYFKLSSNYIIMDNSMHELGEPYSKDKLLRWIDEIKPNEFIIPDKLEDFFYTVTQVEEWSKINIDEDILKVPVIQSSNFGSDFISLYLTYKKMGFNKICIPYGISLYDKYFPHPNKHIRRSMGRVILILKMIEDNIISQNDKLHLLGCNLPWEFKFYQDIPQIETIDTSNPVMAALEGIVGEDYYNIDYKPKLNLNKCIHWDSDKINLKDVITNINIFKKWLGRK